MLTLIVSHDFSPSKNTCPESPDELDTNKAEGLIDNSDMHILDFSPSLKTLAICTVLENKLDQMSLPLDIQ